MNYLKRIPVIFIMSTLMCFVASGEYEAGKLFQEEVTIVGPGIPPHFCIESPNGFQLDSGYTRTGSMMVKRSNGSLEQVNIYIPLTKKAGYNEPIDSKIKDSAEVFCKKLQSMKGKKVSIKMQEYFEEDDGETLKNFYLRGLTFKEGSSTYTFEDNSNSILGPPTTARATAPAPTTEDTPPPVK